MSYTDRQHRWMELQFDPPLLPMPFIMTSLWANSKPKLRSLDTSLSASTSSSSWSVLRQVFSAAPASSSFPVWARCLGKLILCVSVQVCLCGTNKQKEEVQKWEEKSGWACKGMHRLHHSDDSCYLKKWLFPHRIRSPWLSCTGLLTATPFNHVLHQKTSNIRVKSKKETFTRGGGGRFYYCTISMHDQISIFPSESDGNII